MIPGPSAMVDGVLQVVSVSRAKRTRCDALCSGTGSIHVSITPSRVATRFGDTAPFATGATRSAARATATSVAGIGAGGDDDERSQAAIARASHQRDMAALYAELSQVWLRGDRRDSGSGIQYTRFADHSSFSFDEAVADGGAYHRRSSSVAQVTRKARDLARWRASGSRTHWRVPDEAASHDGVRRRDPRDRR